MLSGTDEDLLSQRCYFHLDATPGRLAQMSLDTDEAEWTGWVGLEIGCRGNVATRLRKGIVTVSAVG